MLAKHAVYMADLIGVNHIGLGLDYLDFLDDRSTDSFRSQKKSFTGELEDASKHPTLSGNWKMKDFQKLKLKNHPRKFLQGN